jgi:hypothetical protein
MGEVTKLHNISIGKHEVKRPFGRSKRRLKNNITMDLGKIGWEGVDWMHLAQNRNQQ